MKPPAGFLHDAACLKENLSNRSSTREPSLLSERLDPRLTHGVPAPEPGRLLVKGTRVYRRSALI